MSIEEGDVDGESKAAKGSDHDHQASFTCTLTDAGEKGEGANGIESSKKQWDCDARTVISLSFVLNLVNYLDRAVIGAAAGQIITEFGLTGSQFGWLAGSFGFGAMISNVTSGLVLDRIGVRYAWAASIVAWSATMLGQAYVPAGSYALFIVVRVLMGIAEGVNFVAMDRAHADYVPPRTGSFAVSLSLLGVFLAFVIGYPIFGATVPRHGWRTTFIGLAVAGFVTAIAFFLIYKEQDVSKKHHSQGLSIREEITTLFKDRSLMSTCWSFGSFGYVLGMSVVWLPTFLQSAHSIDLTGASILGIAPWAVASVLMVAVGLLSDRIFAKTSNIRKSQIYVIAACQLLSSICFLPLLFTGESNGTAATICVTLGVGIGLANNAPYFTFCNMRFPSYAAQATGTMIWFFTVGFTCAPFITGYIMDHTSSFSGAFAVVVALLLSAVLMLMLFAFPDKEEVHIITRGTNKL